MQCTILIIIINTIKRITFLSVCWNRNLINRGIEYMNLNIFVSTYRILIKEWRFRRTTKHIWIIPTVNFSRVISLCQGISLLLLYKQDKNILFGLITLKGGRYAYSNKLRGECQLNNINCREFRKINIHYIYIYT